MPSGFAAFHGRKSSFSVPSDNAGVNICYTRPKGCRWAHWVFILSPRLTVRTEFLTRDDGKPSLLFLISEIKTYCYVGAGMWV